MELGSEDSDEGSQSNNSDHEDKESVTNKGLASENGEYKVVLEGLGTDSFSFEVPTCAMDGLGTGPEVSTQDVEAIIEAGSSTEPILLDSEPTRMGPLTKPILLGSEPMHAGSSTQPIFLDSEPTRAGPLTEHTLLQVDYEPMHAGLSTEPIFLNSEPMRTGRKRKAKDMSGLTICFCGERAKLGDAGSIQCRKAGCIAVWVCYPTFNRFMADAAHSTIFNVLGMRTRDRGAGYVIHA
jgi:hypothetical protein